MHRGDEITITGVDAAMGVFSEAVPVADLLVRSARLFPDRIAVAFPEVEFTYGEVLTGAMRTARGLYALGVRPGDHVGILAPNSPEWVESYFGVLLLGAIVVPLNVRYRSSELAYVIDHAQLAVVLTTDRGADRTDFRARITESLPSIIQRRCDREYRFPEAPRLRHLVMTRGPASDGFVGEDDFAAAAATVDNAGVAQLRSQVRIRDVAMVIYTSGTTAQPKGCLISHEAISRGSLGRIVENVPLGDRNAFWCPGPLFHIASMQVFLASIGLGGTFVTDAFFDPNRAWKQIVAHDVTSLWPWFQAVMLGLETAEGFDPAGLAHLQAISLIGPPSFLRRIQSLFPTAVHVNGSGMSELTGYYAMSPLDDSQEFRATTGGKPVNGVEVKIVDPESGVDVGTNTIGEILVRGYLRMEGYYRDPERTAEVIDPEGWMHTGDLYIMDDSGHITFEGRLKDMLKVGGENVPAIEVEELLCSHPCIRIAEVVGQPDEKLDEVPVAFLELAEGVSLEADELIEWCRGRIASFKVPRAIYFKTADEWPMSATKIDKVALRKELRTDRDSVHG